VPVNIFRFKTEGQTVRITLPTVTICIWYCECS